MSRRPTRADIETETSLDVRLTRMEIMLADQTKTLERIFLLLLLSVLGFTGAESLEGITALARTLN